MGDERLQAIHELSLNRFRLPDAEPFDSNSIPTLEQIWNTAKPNIANARKGQYKDYDDLALTWSMNDLQAIARQVEEGGRRDDRWNHFQQIAGDVRVIVNFSAPGLYTAATKEDNYKDKPYMAWGDRRLADTAAQMGIVTAGLQIGRDYSGILQDPVLTGFEPDFADRRDEIHAAIAASGIQFKYYGKATEANGVRAALEGPRSYIPKESTRFKVHRINDTLDQVRKLGPDLRCALETGALKPRDIVAMPALSQATRILSMMQQHNTIPSELRLAIMPVPTPTPGVTEYVSHEISKTMWSILKGDASLRPQKAIILGA